MMTAGAPEPGLLLPACSTQQVVQLPACSTQQIVLLPACYTQQMVLLPARTLLRHCCSYTTILPEVPLTLENASVSSWQLAEREGAVPVAVAFMGLMRLTWRL